jgi:hypothetical protein
MEQKPNTHPYDRRTLLTLSIEDPQDISRQPRDPATMDTSLCHPPPFGLRTGAPPYYFVVPAPPAATMSAGPPPMPNNDDDTCPFCHDSSAPTTAAASLGRREQRRRKTATRKRQRGHWGYHAGYSGPKYCQRCSEVFRYHIMEQMPNSANCSRESPCQICVQVLPHYRLQGSALWAAMDAAKKRREDFKAAPGRVQRASRMPRMEQLLDKQATASASSTHVMLDPRLEDRESRVAQGVARPAPESAKRKASNTLAGIRMVVGGNKFGATTQRAQQQRRPARNGSEVVNIRDESEFVAQGSRNKRPRPHALRDDSHRVSQRTSFSRDVPQVGSGDALHRYVLATTPPIDWQHSPLVHVHSTSAHEPKDNMVGEGMMSDAPGHQSTDPPTMQSMQAREVYDHWLEDPWE